MEYRKLGNTDIDVSVICLGTMSYGEQNTEKEAHEQLDYSLDRGVNFIDTAEMYAIPPKKETYGKTEELIGTWIKRRGERSKYIIATKVAGPGMEYVRGGSRLSSEHIMKAVESSLKRLQTDYIDLYQVHWPERKSNYFGRLGYEYSEDTGIAIEETYKAMDKLVRDGKVRYLGISNETPWGINEYLRLEREHGYNKIMSIQNPYSLLNRIYEVGLAEITHRENVGLLAYSPLGFGMLTGKYAEGTPSDSRLGLYGDWFTRYSNKPSIDAVSKYINLAREFSITPTQLALAFVNSRPFLTSNIIGATKMSQLEENIDSIEVSLNTEILEAIEEIHVSNPNPAP
ncbi:MAG: NADP(H)-dependent aldo-keto reductase [Gammaproteobacteria bacterium]|nr:NADP(H)-dependent aldo-keto reductase [Gammaproteobacteria bacterium]